MQSMEKKELIKQSRAAIAGAGLAAPDTFIAVSVARQILLFVKESAVLREYPVSTSRFGMGSAEGSLKTPSGVHRIAIKYGFSAPLYRIFTDRIDTGRVWTPDQGSDNFVLTRIMWLKGLEAGVNQGAGIDSFDRYIYIHGTANEPAIGQPWTHGCVGMRNQDVAGLFDEVSEGTLVVINQ
jgi:lipoprotein-anchoring transpeptidase ErfK/SrfK